MSGIHRAWTPGPNILPFPKGKWRILEEWKEKRTDHHRKKHKDDNELEIAREGFACNKQTDQPTGAELNGWEWSGTCLTSSANKHGLQRNAVEKRKGKLNLKENRSDHRGTRQEAREQWVNAYLASSLFHSFVGQHPLFKSIHERLRCLHGNTSTKAQDQTWMRMAASA